MFGALSLVAMRQQADEARHAQPLAFARRDELVEQNLRAVGEVAELRFPQGQRFRLGEGIAVFEAEDGFFRQHGIDDFVLALLAFVQMIERRVTTLRLLIDQHGMALRECAALDILPGQAHAMAVPQEGREGHGFGHRPVDSLSGLDHLAAIVEEALDRAVHVEAFRRLVQLEAEHLEMVDIDARFAATVVVTLGDGLEAGPAAIEPVGLVGLVGLTRFELGLETMAPVAHEFVDFAPRQQAFRDQLVAIDFQRRLMRADLAIHQRLRERRLVAFVVAEAAIAPHVDHDGLLEPHPEFGRDLRGEHDRLGIIAVHVEDRRLDHLRHVGWIRRGTRIARIGGEADLVIDDEVDRAAGAMALEARQAEAFGDDALARECRVAVDQQRHDGAAVVALAAVLVLLGAHLAEYDGVDDLEMRGICGEREMNLVGVELAVRGRAEMVLHVAGALDLAGNERAALELVEQRAMRLAHHLAEHVEAAAMGHAEHDFLGAERAAALDDLLERRDHRFAAVETEALGAGVFDVDELLEAFGLDQLLQDRALAFVREGDFLVRTLDALLQPRLLRRVGDVHEFVADGRAISAAQDREHLENGRIFEAEHVIDEDLAIVVAVLETVARRVQLLVIHASLDAERIEIGVQMTAHAIGADHHDGANRIAGGPHDVGVGDRRARSGGLGLDLVAERLFRGRPVAVERVDEIALRRRRPVLVLPGSAARILFDGALVVLQRVEEFAPLRIDRSRILLVGVLQLRDIGRVAAIEKRSVREGCVLRRATRAGSIRSRIGHAALPWIARPERPRGIRRAPIAARVCVMRSKTNSGSPPVDGEQPPISP